MHANCSWLLVVSCAAYSPTLLLLLGDDILTCMQAYTFTSHICMRLWWPEKTSTPIWVITESRQEFWYWPEKTSVDGSWSANMAATDLISLVKLSCREQQIRRTMTTNLRSISTSCSLWWYRRTCRNPIWSHEWSWFDENNCLNNDAAHIMPIWDESIADSSWLVGQKSWWLGK